MSIVEVEAPPSSAGRGAERARPLAIGLTLRASALAGSLVLGFAALQLTGAAALELGGPRSLPTICGAILLAVAGVLAWRLADAEPRASVDRLEWRLAAILFGLLAVDQAASLHEWIRTWTGAGWTVSFMPLVAIATAIWIARCSALIDRPTSLNLWVAGAAAWLGGQLPEAVGSAYVHRDVGATFEFGGAALLALALAVAVVSAGRGSGRPDIRELFWGRVERLVLAVNARRASAGLAVAIASVIVLGGLLLAFDLEHDRWAEGPVTLADRPWQWFDISQELSFATYFSGMMLGLAAGLALLLARLRAGGGTPLIWVALAAILAAMGIDDIVDIHGALQTTTGELAQVTLAPLVGAAGLVGLSCLFRIRAQTTAAILFAAGGVAWVVVLGLDWWTSANPITGPMLNHASLGLGEEALEMYGSAMLGLALLLVARSSITGRDAVEPAASGPPTLSR